MVADISSSDHLKVNCWTRIASGHIGYYLTSLLLSLYLLGQQKMLEDETAGVLKCKHINTSHHYIERFIKHNRKEVNSLTLSGLMSHILFI